MKALRKSIGLKTAMAGLLLGFLAGAAVAQLPANRLQDFEDWPETSMQYVTEEREGWRIEDVLLLRSGIYYYPSDNGAYFKNEIGAQFRSPLLTNGVGTVYFSASVDNSQFPVEVTVETSSDGVSWNAEKSFSITRMSDNTPLFYKATLNIYDDVYVRLRRTTEDPARDQYYYVRVDNIHLSPPPAYVDMAWKLYEPGYPSSKQDVTVRAVIEDSTPDAPATNRQVSVHYRWRENEFKPWTDFSSTNMLPVGDNVYEGTLPAQSAGTVQYYYRCEYDGYFYTGPTGLEEERGLVYLWESGQSESGAVDDYFSYDVRVFNSNYSGIEVYAYPSSHSSSMTLMGDHLWQAMINVSGLTNMNFTLAGNDYYTPGAEEFAFSPDNWGDADQEFPNPPLAGHVEPDAQPVELEFEYDGFLMIRLNTTNLEYSVKRAAYQDFNEWQASPNYFEESLGLYAVQTFLNDFDDWPLDVVTEDMKATEDFQSEPQNDATYQSFQTMGGWWAENARRFRDRMDLAGVTPATRNRSLMLKPAYGVIQNLNASLVQYGLDTFSFWYRAALDDNHLTWLKYYLTGGTQNFACWSWEDYTVSAKIGAQQMSKANPSVSVLSHLQDSGNYYELRLVQVRGPGGGDTEDDNWLQAQYWISKNGQLEPLYTWPTYMERRLTDQRWDVEFTVENLGGTTQLRAVFNNITIGSYDVPDADRITGPGTIGFHSRDAVILADDVGVTGIDGVTTLLSNRDFSSESQMDEWFRANDSTGTPRWQRISNRLTRPLSSQTFYVDQQTSVDDAAALNPSDWELAQTLHADSLTLEKADVELHNWEQTFVRIRSGAGDWAIVVDDLETSPWRGLGHERDGWSVDAAWIASAGGDDHELELDRSRAKDGPDVPVEDRIEQVLVSPLLTNGLGTISFNFDTSGNSVFSVERTNPGDLTAWVTLDTVTNLNVQNVSYFLPVRTNMVGYLRVRHTSASDDDAVLTLDHVRVRDYPAAGDTTWKGYNVLISNTDDAYALGERTFEGISCFLNNSAVDGTAPNEVFDEDKPYVQSPAVGTGIGEIAFWARVWDPEDTRSGEIVLMKAPDIETPLDSWEEIARVTISNETYQYYDWEIFDQDNKVVRIYAETNNRQRVAIDNLLVTEPVRAGFEIVDVTLDPVQPLNSDSVTVRARLDRFLMNPTDIEVFIRYRTGTNNWGLTDWVDSNYIEIPMIEIAHREYETTSPIPASAIDTVVQYAVAATYEGPNAVDLVTQLEFTNPDWYTPVDLNESLEGWAPYYFVYSCPTGSVWINEFNYRTSTAERDSEYIEFVGPGGADLSGWTVELISNVSPFNLRDSYTLDPGSVLEDTHLGWGFMLVGDSEVPGVVKEFSPPESVNMETAGGIVLKRSMGAWEHRVVYGSGGYDALVDQGFDYAGFKNPFLFGANRSLGLESSTSPGGVSRADFDWGQASTGNHTPGGVNEDQNLFEIDSLDPGSVPELASVSIESFQFVGGKIEIVATGTNDWTGIPEYRTNLLSGTWDAVDVYNCVYENGQFLIDFDPPESGNVHFYRVKADPAN